MCLIRSENEETIRVDYPRLEFISDGNFKIRPP